MARFHDSISDREKITCGVPEGSIIGPFLFLIYMNDIYRCSEVLTFILFADDSNIFFLSCELKNP